MKFAKTLTGLLAVGMLFGLSAQNLVENSSFENGISQWAPPAWKRPDGRIWLTPQEDKTVSQGAGGTASMKLDWNKNNVVYIWYYKEIPLNGLQEVELSFWAKSVGYNDANITEIEVSFPEVKDPKAKREIVGNAWNRVPKDWTLFKKQFKVPAGATKAKLCIRFHGFKSQKGTSWIDNVYFGAVQKDDGQSAKKIIVLKRGVPVCDHGGIYYPGEQMKYSVEFNENTVPGKEMSFAWQIQDFDGKTVAEGTKKVTLPKSKDGAFQIQLPDLKEFRGWFALKGKFVENGRTLADFTSSGVVVEKQTGRRDPFYSAKDPGTIEKQIRMGNGSSNFLAQRRVQQASQDTLHPKEAQRLKAWLEMCEKYGFEPFFIFHISQYTTPNNQQQPLYIRDTINAKLAKGLNPYDAAYYQTWKNYFSSLLDIADGRVRDWYIGDEVYNIYHRSALEVPHYVGVLKCLYEVVKKRNPDFMVGGGSTFMDKDPLGRKMWHMVKDHLDGLSCSLYLGKGTVAKGMVLDGPESGKLLDRFKDTRSVIGDKKFVAGTESGYSFLDFPKIDSEMVKEIAKINARNLVTLRYLGVRKWTFFTFDNDGMYESRKWGSGRIDYGMWNKAYGSPKPHAATWAVSARALAHVTDPMDASPCSDVYCYVFKKGNKTLAAFWAYVKEDIDAQIDLPSAWSGVDFLGHPLKGKAGLQNFKLNDRVLYLEFDAPQEAVVKAFRNGKYILPAVYIAAHRVDEGKVSVTVKNKLAGDLNAAVTLNKLPAKNISVKRGTAADVIFDCPPGSGTLDVTVLANGVKYHLKKDDEWYGVARLSALPAIQNGVLKGFEKVQPLVMDSVKHLKPADIDSHGIWTGKDDLSAKIYLGYDKSFFYIGAEIFDDAHIVRYAGELSWNQDSVQCAFDTGNNSFDNQLSPGGYDSDDREFIFADTPKGPETFCYAGSSDIERKVIGKPQIFRSSGKTVYLVRIPWSQLGRLKPVAGTVFGFNIVAFDFDAKATTTSCQMEFSPGITYGKTPALFKRFILK